MGKKEVIPHDVDLITKKTEDKNKWNWVIRVDKLRYTLVDGKPVIHGYTILPEFLHVTTSSKEQEFELIDYLTTDRGNYGAPSETKLYQVLKNEPDQYYRLTVFKQSVASKIYGVPLWGVWGWCLVSKNADKILWETRYFQQGPLHDWNLETRDPIEDTRRKASREIPSGGIDYKW